MIGCAAASSLPWSGSSIAILTVPLSVPPAALGDAPPDAPPDEALGALLPLGAVVAAPPPHAAKVRTATPASAPTLEILIQYSSSDPITRSLRMTSVDRPGSLPGSAS